MMHLPFGALRPVSFRHGSASVEWHFTTWAGIVVLWLLASLTAVPSVAASEGLLFLDDTVYRVDELPSTDPTLEPILVIDGSEAVAATLVGDEWITVLQTTLDTQSLARFDAATGGLRSSMPIDTPPDVGLLHALGVAPDGTLWALARDLETPGTAGSHLGALDPDTGTFTIRATIDAAIDGLVFDRGRASTLILPSSGQPAEFAAIDLDTGALESLGLLDEIECALSGDLAIDDGRVLHVAVSLDCGILVPPSPRIEIYSYRFAPDEPPQPLVLLADDRLDLLGVPAALRVTGGGSVVAVPALETAGIALLAALLAVAGFASLRRRD